MSSISSILQQAGIVSSKSSSSSIGDELELAGATRRSVIEKYVDLQENSENDNVKLSANNKLAEMHGLITKDKPLSMAPITIVINDTKAPVGINPILIPREQ